ncbi:MAG: excinuclease ABC subunit UvrC [Clostridia bacterium]|nr:excinuclease ABC subunit UvrC [Clostridia bacterium]
MDNEALKKLKAEANRLPLTPGVYIMRDKSDEIIYIGKAKALKNRVTQYFGKGTAHTEKVRQMVSRVHRFEYILCDSEFEALILENSLIKQHKPKYNILLKDDKGYHYIKITKERWPKLLFAMQINNDKAEYIGPYYSSVVVKDTVDEVRKIFGLPSCNRSFDKYSKPCLNYHIGICDAPCKANITREEYMENLNAAVKFIKNGGKEMKDILYKKMNAAAERLDFEYAAKLRDRINAINNLKDRQKVVMCNQKSQDVFASVFLGEKACISLFVFRNSKLVDKKHFIIEGITEKDQLYAEFLGVYYDDKNDFPSRILFDTLPEGDENLARFLSEKAGKKITFSVPQKGENMSILAMCKKNAAEALAHENELTGKSVSALNELARLLGLTSTPRIIESYDISNIAGDTNVAGMVVFHDGKPYKPHYRKFIIKSFVGQDDFRSLNEVLDRRFSEYEKGEDKGFSTLPDLILLDGGKGQLSAVKPVLAAHNITVPVFGMVKDGHHKTRALTDGTGDIEIKATRSAYTLVTNIQDEVHRFAISFHKAKRSKNMVKSSLLDIPGVGKNTAALLLKTFKTIKKIKAAGLNDLAAVKGINKTTAENIYNHYHK